MGKRTHRVNEAERSITASCYTPIDDPNFSPLKMVLLVDNNSDADMARARGEQVAYDRSGNERGKPGMFGLPGGGMKADDFESPREAARNEHFGETGLKVRFLRDFISDTELKGIPVDRNGHIVEGRRPIPFEKGKRPANIDLGPGETLIENAIYVFEAVVDWEASRLQKALIEYKNRLTSRLDNPISEDEIAYFGIWTWFDNLGLESILKDLGVNITEDVDHLLVEKGLELNDANRRLARAAKFLDIEEFHEIRGIGIFPIRTLLTEIWDSERDKPRGERSFYPSHLRRIQKGLEEKKVLDQIMGAE